MKFSTKLVVLFSCLVLVIGISVSYLIYQSNSGIIQKLITERLEDEAFHTMDKIDMLLFERHADMRALANDPIIRSRNSTTEQITEKLNQFQKAYKHYISLALFDMNRIRIADTTGKNIGKQHSFSEYWPAIAGGGKDSHMVVTSSESSGKTVFYFAAVVRDGKGIPVGVVASKMPVEDLYVIADKLGRIHKDRADPYVDLVDKNGILLYSNYNKKGLLTEVSPDWDFVRGAFSSASSVGSMKYTNPKEKLGEEILVFVREHGYLDFRGNDWALIEYIPTSVAFAPAKEMRNKMMAIFLSFAVVIVVAISIFSRRITRPIEELNRATIEMGKGNLDVKVGAASRDELGQLAASFNEMSADLREYRDRLLAHSVGLEMKVAERTLELREVNEKLNVELEERKRAQDELREKEEKLRTITDTARDAIVMIDEDGRISFWNRAAEEIFGYDSSEALGKDLHIFLGPQRYHGAYRKGFEIFRKSGQGAAVGKTLELEAVRRDRSEFKIELSLSAIQLKGKWHAVGIVRDITSRKQTEEDLRSSRARFRSLVEATSDWVWEVDERGTYVYASPQIRDILGYEPKEVCGKTPFDLMPPDEARRVDAIFKEIAASQMPFSFLENVNLHKDGRKVVLESSGVPIYHADGTFHGYSGVDRDITRRKRAEELLRESEARVRTILEAVQTGILMIDSETHVILEANPVAERMIGLSKDLIVGLECHKFICPAERGRCPITDLGQTVDNSERILVTAGGEQRSIIKTVSSVTLGGRRLLVESFVDITERKHIEEELKILNDELERKVQERTKELLDAQEELVRKEKLSILGQLSGSVGHELRNPLGVINNAVYYLGTVMPDSPEPVKEYLKIIKNELNTSERIISDLLDFSRTKMPQLASVMPCEVIRRGLEQCAIPGNVALEIDVPDTLPPVRIDPFQMGQVFQNLITNAIQAMPDGGVLRISVRLLKEDEKVKSREDEKGGLTSQPPIFPSSEVNYIEVSVSDTGEGVSPENMKKLFQPLFTTKAKGIGLGLVVCKKLTEANGGSIKVESEVGRGTTFTVYVPVAK